jgi:hypothetical protein
MDRAGFNHHSTKKSVIIDDARKDYKILNKNGEARLPRWFMYNNSSDPVRRLRLYLTNRKIREELTCRECGKVCKKKNDLQWFSEKFSPKILLSGKGCLDCRTKAEDIIKLFNHIKELKQTIKDIKNDVKNKAINSN